MTIGERIRNERIKKGWTQNELAWKLGYADKGAISLVELGRRNIDNEMLIKYADVLGVTPTYLLGWEDDEDSFSEDEKDILKTVSENEHTKKLLMDYAVKLLEILK